MDPIDNINYITGFMFLKMMCDEKYSKLIKVSMIFSMLLSESFTYFNKMVYKAKNLTVFLIAQLVRAKKK